MRILQLLSQTQPTGAEAYALALSDWLTDQGHKVWIVSDKLHSASRQPYIPLAVHESRLTTRIRSTRFLRTFLQENQIQVIHCHSRAAARLAYWSTLGLKINGAKVAVVSTLHGRQPISLSKKLHDIFGDKCISICENLTTQVTETLNMNPRKIRLIRNPLATKDLPFVSELTSAPKLAWVGRFTGPKGLRAQQFIELQAPALLEKIPGLTIDMIGGDPALLGDQALQRLAKLQETWPGQITVENFRPHLEQELSQYRLVLAAGRIAMASLIRGIPTFAIGEYESVGLVTLGSFAKALGSNFGDIGSDGKPMADVDFTADVDTILSLLVQPPLSESERTRLREQMIAEFDLPLVAQRVLNTYKSAYFLANHPANIPVLMYHKVPSTDIATKHRIYVTVDTFEKHLQFFQKKGFTTLHFADLEKYRSGEADFSTFPAKPVVLTFDDGYRDNLANAGPLLKRYDAKAVIYLLADHTLSNNSWDLNTDEEPAHELMTLEEKRRLPEYGFEIGSHGFCHRKITDMSDAEVQTELEGSKALLEKDLGVPVFSFAFTYGVTSPKATALAENAGYTFALNTDAGGLHLEENPFAIFRANIFPEDGPAQLRKKTATWYRRYFYFKRGR